MRAYGLVPCVFCGVLLRRDNTTHLARCSAAALAERIRLAEVYCLLIDELEARSRIVEAWYRVDLQDPLLTFDFRDLHGLSWEEFVSGLGVRRTSRRRLRLR